MNLTRIQTARPIYINQLYFCMLAMNNQKIKFLLQYTIQKSDIFREKICQKICKTCTLKTIKTLFGEIKEDLKGDILVE